MYEHIYTHCATIEQAAQDLMACKNRNNKMPQKRAIQTIGHYAKRLEYAIQSLKTVPAASMQAYIQRQLMDALTPIIGSAESLNDYHHDKLNTCQIFHLEQVINNCNELMEILAQKDEQAS